MAMHDPDDEIFAVALAASATDVRVPEEFADAVVARVSRSRRRARAVWTASVVIAAAACALFAWSRRARDGVVDVATEGPSRTVVMGDRGRMVVEPGTRARWHVGGIFRRDDRVELERGAAFFRIDHGGAFEVRTPHGTVSVTGTCFRVAATSATEGGDAMDRSMRLRWFGAGVLATSLAVTVYEGGVRVASAHGHDTVRLGPGESAHVANNGALARGAGLVAQPLVDSATPMRVASNTTVDDAHTNSEVERLRGVLVANGINPETGQRFPGGTNGSPSEFASHPHLLDSGDTNLTPDEWRMLAEHHELRYRLPGLGGRGGSPLTSDRARDVGLPDSEIDDVNAALDRDREHLVHDLQSLYREAAGTDPGNLSPDALQNEIRDKTPDTVVAQVDYELAQERGGLATAPSFRPDMPPYERMMRELIGYETQVEQDLSEIVGPAIAHELVFGDHRLGGWSFGRSTHQPTTP